jgi:hypothetical protein
VVWVFRNNINLKLWDGSSTTVQENTVLFGRKWAKAAGQIWSEGTSGQAIAELLDRTPVPCWAEAGGWRLEAVVNARGGAELAQARATAATFYGCATRRWRMGTRSTGWRRSTGTYNYETATAVLPGLPPFVVLAPRFIPAGINGAGRRDAAAGCGQPGIYPGGWPPATWSMISGWWWRRAHAGRDCCFQSLLVFGRPLPMSTVG